MEPNLSSNKALVHTLFQQREHLLFHYPFEEEIGFYRAVQTGNLKVLKQKEAAGDFNTLNSKKRGTLSYDNLRNNKYHLIINIAMLTRFCIQGGLETKTAYNLSDYYIQKVDVSRTSEELYQIHINSIYDFAQRMRQLKRGNYYSPPILKTINYIEDHLSQPLPVAILAKEVNLNETYLSKLFKKETGTTLHRYILQKRVDNACYLLVYSDLSYVDIANSLEFQSHSYFIKVFKQFTGYTPKEYRLMYLL